MIIVHCVTCNFADDTLPVYSIKQHLRFVERYEIYLTMIVMTQVRNLFKEDLYSIGFTDQLIQ